MGFVFSLCELNSNILVSGSSDNTLRFWDYVNYKKLKANEDKELGYTYAIAKINDKEIAVGSLYNYGLIRIYNWVDSIQKECTHVLKGHKSEIYGFVLSEDKTTLFSCSYDKTIKIWNLSDYTCIKTLEGHSDRVWNILLFRPDILCSVSGDSLIKFWDIESGRCIHTLHGNKYIIFQAIISKKGVFVSVGNDKIVRFWRG